MTDEVLIEMLERLKPYTPNIDPDKIMPRVSWSPRA